MKSTAWLFSGFMKTNLRPLDLKGMVQPKILIPPLFIHLHVVPNLHEFLSSAEHTKIYFKGTQSQVLATKTATQ